MNKKKIFAIALAVCLIAILSFSTLAWFTSTDQADNVFTVGSIKIEQNEQEYVRDENGDRTTELQDFEQNQYMLPVVNTEDVFNDDNYLDKIVTVKSTGANEAYVRTFIAVDARIADYLYLDLNLGDNSKWVRDEDRTATIDGQAYKVLAFTYTEALGTDEVTDVLLKGVYLGANVDVKEVDGVKQFCHWDADNSQYVYSGYDVNDAVHVYVATQGVQARGFENAAQALDSAFGDSVPSFS